MNIKNITTMKTTRWMKTAMMLVAGTFVFTACDNDDDKFNAPEAVQAAFNQQYGDNTRVEWDRERGEYLIAEFWKDNKEYDAWYTYDGRWMMTEVDYGHDIQALPQAVQDGFNASAYAQWRVDDIDLIQRPDYTDIYKIEVEQQGQRDMDLYFDENGTLFKEVADADDDRNEGMLPTTSLPNEIQNFIDERYPNARIADFDKERSYYEVDVIVNSQSKEIIFDSAYSWVLTSTDLGRNIPAVVENAINQKYADKRIDDCDEVETAQGEHYYLVDLDNYEMDIRVDENGQTSEVRD